MHTNRKATVWGDTSRVHLVAGHNYLEFRKLVAGKFEILQEISHRCFRNDFAQLARWRYPRFPRILWSMYRQCPVKIPKFLNLVRRSQYWDGMQESDVIIVHGEGLTEKANNSACCLLAISQLAKELGKECWLVNFSMFDAEPFVGFLRKFDYIACRDSMTHRHLASLGIDAELSFDCCVLGTEMPEYSADDGSVAVIRGRRRLEDELLSEFDKPVKFDAAWRWKTDDVRSCADVDQYCCEINKSRFSLSTSFHGNILSFLAGVPFITFEDKNKKFEAVRRELLPGEGREFVLQNRDWIGKGDTRRMVYDHYLSIVDTLKLRAKRNCP